MCKNRILGPSIITVIAVIFCLITARVEQAAQQDPQPDKSANRASNPQSSGAQSSDPQSSDAQSSAGVAPARWPIILPKKSPTPVSQPPVGAPQEQKPEEKQERKTEEKQERK